jgi:hypothetical protein
MSSSPTDPQGDSVRVRLLKVLRLAQEGAGGERENAEALLAKLLRRHGMTMADLEGALDQPRVREWLPAGDDEERTVLSQLVVRLHGIDRPTWRRGATELGVEVSPAEHAALRMAWEVYRGAFAEARQALVLGFCYKHGLYAAEGSEAPEMSAEARGRAARALALAGALPVVDPPQRRLGGGDSTARD